MTKPLLCRLGVHTPYRCEYRTVASSARHHCTRCPRIWIDTRSAAAHAGHTRLVVYLPSRQRVRAVRRSLERLRVRGERILGHRPQQSTKGR